MDLLGLALSLSLPLQGGKFTGDYSLDINPTIGLHAPTDYWGAAATTLPGLVLYNPEELAILEAQGESREEVMRHELMHVEQQAALGPAFWLAYALGGGREFEPQHQQTGLPSTGKWNEYEVRSHTDYSQMWMPDESMRGQYPLFRLARDEGRTRLQFMPGYPGVTIE